MRNLSLSCTCFFFPFSSFLSFFDKKKKGEHSDNPTTTSLAHADLALLPLHSKAFSLVTHPLRPEFDLAGREQELGCWV